MRQCNFEANLRFLGKTIPYARGSAAVLDVVFLLMIKETPIRGRLPRS
jgi:hypothetical protein